MKEDYHQTQFVTRLEVAKSHDHFSPCKPPNPVFHDLSATSKFLAVSTMIRELESLSLGKL